MIPQEKQEALIKVLREIAGSNRTIDKSTLIYEDLLISGDDAADLIERIHKEFGASFRNFRFSDYFPDETESIFHRIFLLFARSKKKPLTVGHLLEVIDRGEWFD
jgi:hypothetical protein